MAKIALLAKVQIKMAAFLLGFDHDCNSFFCASGHDEWVYQISCGYDKLTPMARGGLKVSRGRYFAIWPCPCAAPPKYRISDPAAGMCKN